MDTLEIRAQSLPAPTPDRPLLGLTDAGDRGQPPLACEAIAAAVLADPAHGSGAG